MSTKIEIRELRAELRYWQMQARMEARWLLGSRRKCQEIGAKMRALQNPAVIFLDHRPEPFNVDAKQEILL